MRIERCAECDGRKVTVYIEDDSVRATDVEAVNCLLAAFDAAMGSGKQPEEVK